MKLFHTILLLYLVSLSKGKWVLVLLFVFDPCTDGDIRPLYPFCYARVVVYVTCVTACCVHCVSDRPAVYLRMRGDDLLFSGGCECCCLADQMGGNIYQLFARLFARHLPLLWLPKACEPTRFWLELFKVVGRETQTKGSEELRSVVLIVSCDQRRPPPIYNVDGLIVARCSISTMRYVNPSRVMCVVCV